MSNNSVKSHPIITHEQERKRTFKLYHMCARKAGCSLKTSESDRVKKYHNCAKNAGCSLKKEKYAIPLTKENEQIIQRILNLKPFIGLPGRVSRSAVINLRLCKQMKNIEKSFEKEMKEKLDVVTDLNNLVDWISSRMDKDLQTVKTLILESDKDYSKILREDYLDFRKRNITEFKKLALKMKRLKEKRIEEANS